MSFFDDIQKKIDAELKGAKKPAQAATPEMARPPSAKLGEAVQHETGWPAKVASGPVRKKPNPYARAPKALELDDILDSGDIREQRDNANASVVEALRRHADFHLGGSRRMAELHPSKVHVKASTDWDFYATDSRELRRWLEARGFEKSDHSGYEADTEVMAIYQRDGIDALLRRDALFYKSVFEAIPVHFYRSHIWKSSPKFRGDRDEIMTIMNTLFSVGRAFHGGGEDD